MKIKHLSLRSFRGVKHMELDFTKSVTAFVGVNGVGKSTVLDALAIALSQLTWRINGHPQKARPIALDDILQGDAYARIELTVELRGSPLTWAITTNRKKGQHSDPLRTSQLEALNDAVKKLNAEWEHYESDRQTPYNLPLAVYYDVNRAVLDIPMRVRTQLRNIPDEVYQDALDHGGADFKRFFAWFRQREDFENEQIRDKPNFKDRSLEAVRSSIFIFTGFTEMRIRRTPLLRMSVVKNGFEFNVSQLSDGERNMLALVGDLARRLSVLNPGLENPNHGSGVVIIDEIDLHLHPRWQREVIQKLEQTFPNCQFVVSTHSPQIIGELNPESVMLLKDGELMGSAMRSLGLSSAEILREIMGTSERNIEFDEAVRQIEQEIEDEQYDSAGARLFLLEKKYGQLPEVLRLSESLIWWTNPQEEGDPESETGDAQ